MAISFQVTFDAADPRALGAFWRELLGYAEQPPPAGYGSWDALMDEMGRLGSERDEYFSVMADPEGNEFCLQ